MTRMQADAIGLHRDGVCYSSCRSPWEEDMSSPRPWVTYERDSLNFDMGGEKHMFVFTFLKTSESGPETPRPGSDFDEAKLQETFGNIGFTVHMPCKFSTRRQVFKKLKDILNMNHVNTSCVAIVFLTYGDAGGKVNAPDKTFLLKDVINEVMHSSSLAGKPKLFFNQVTTLGSEPQSCEISLVRLV